MKKNNDNCLIEVFAGTSTEVGIVRSLLENADINTFLKDNYMGTLAPWNVAGGGAGAVNIFINSKDYVNARLIIEKYEENINKH